MYLKPIYEKRKFYCPICDTGIKRNHKVHCGVPIDWTDAPKVNQQIRVTEALRHEGLRTSVIAERINYERNYVAHMLNGDNFMNDQLMEYLIEEIEVYVRKLKALQKELKRRIKE